MTQDSKTSIEDRGPHGPPRILATDLDGTLIPLDEDPRQKQALGELTRQLSEHAIPLVYVTGRHRASIEQAMLEHQLPRPQWIVSDVGTTLYHVTGRSDISRVTAYEQHLEELCGGWTLPDIAHRLRELSGLRLQEEEHQGRFKLSYYADAAATSTLTAEIEARLRAWEAPFGVVASVDPFDGRGLIDILPRHVTKAYALDWWALHAAEADRDQIVFAGDSGNDLAALVAGYRAIVVSNAHRDVAAAAEKTLAERGWRDRLWLATQPATCGVLEGCLYFGLFDSET